MPGHWDQIIGQDSGSASAAWSNAPPGSCCCAPPRPDGAPDHGALAVQEAMVAKMSQLPDNDRLNPPLRDSVEMASI